MSLVISNLVEDNMKKLRSGYYLVSQAWEAPSGHSLDEVFRT